LKLLQQAGII